MRDGIINFVRREVENIVVFLVNQFRPGVEHEAAQARAQGLEVLGHLFDGFLDQARVEILLRQHRR